LSAQSVRRRSLAWWVRWAHVYVSMVGFVSLFLFAITGLTLNHASFFEGEGVPREIEGRMEAAWLDDGEGDVDRLAIVEGLRARHDVRGLVHDFLVDDQEILIVFKGPGYAADATIERDGGGYVLVEQARGFMAVLDDLHKGRDSGAAWSVFIDASAILMALTSLSGLWLLLYLRQRRGAALWTAAVGGVATVAVFLIAVP